MRKIIYLMFLFLIGLIASSCRNDDGLILPPVDEPKPAPGNPEMEAFFGQTPVIVWIEAAANFSRLSTAEKMSAVFQKLADTGVTGIVVDVKGISGLVSYNSSIAEHFKSWDGTTMADDFDYLQNILTEAKKKNLKVFVSISTFVEGFNHNGVKLGKVYSDPEFSKIQSQVATVSGEVRNITDVSSYGFINPVQPLAQQYELSLITEIVTNYEIDGFVLDYCRFTDISADFSDFTLNKFKEWAGLSSIKMTDIVKSWKISNGAVVPNETGEQYKKWLEFRSHVIHDFVQEAHKTVKAIKPELPFCSYSGAWYDSYYHVGVNWASNTFDPSVNGFSWATSTYKNTGYAEQLDMFITGNYTSNLYGNGWWTVEGQIAGAKMVLKGANIHYGAIDIGNTTWSNMENMQNAVVMILEQTSGIMLFDLVHIDEARYNQFQKPLYDDLKIAITNGLNKRK